MGVLSGAVPFAADGGEIGVVLSHGLTGSARSLRRLAEHPAAVGLTVRPPRLPGSPELVPAHIPAPAAG